MPQIHDVHLAESAGSIQARPLRQTSDDWVGRIVLLLVSWCSTYNSAYMSGDDVVHFQGGYGKKIFLPTFKTDWIPNRVLDTYGRNLFTHVFDLIFFPLKSLFQMDFFHFYKIFNATLFSAFLLLIHRYVMRQVHDAARRLQPDGADNARGILPGLFVTFAIMAILPWVNDVQLICYQVSAFISFVVLAEIFKGIPATPWRGRPAISMSWLITMGFVAAFSLEAYSAILLGALFLAWMMHWPRRAGQIWRAPAFIASILIAVFCMAALLIASLYSQRAVVSTKLSVFKQIFAFFFANGSLTQSAKMDCVLVMACFIGTIALAVFSFRHRQRRETTIQLTASADSTPLMSWMSLLMSVLLPTIVVTALISLKSDENYFSLGAYPWGGLLLICLFCLIPTIAISTAWPAKGYVAADSARIFFLALILSSAAIRMTEQSAQHYDDSAHVLDAYRQAQVHSEGTFDTGLSLDTMPMQSRPLPTAASPAWFIDAYVRFFKKYYGADTHALFK